jgi:hypothetical protein
MFFVQQKHASPLKLRYVIILTEADLNFQTSNSLLHSGPIPAALVSCLDVSAQDWLKLCMQAQVFYESLTDYNIRFVIEWPGKDKAESFLACKLQLQDMIEVGEMNPYQKHEASTLKQPPRAVLGISDRNLSGFIFLDHPFMTTSGCMFIPLDLYRSASKSTIKSKITEPRNLRTSSCRSASGSHGCTRRKRIQLTARSALELSTFLSRGEEGREVF